MREAWHRYKRIQLSRAVRLLALFKRTTRGRLLLALPPKGVYSHEVRNNAHENTTVLRIGQEGT